VFLEHGTQSGIFAASIFDSVAGRIYALDVAHKTYVEGDGGGDAAEEVKAPGNAEEQVVEGMNCFRVGPLGVVEEGWFSIELQHMLWERSKMGDKSYLWQTHRVVAGEPDPALFLPPPAFTKMG